MNDAQTPAPTSVGDWILTYIVMCIPLVNIVMLIVWAASASTEPSKSNWAKATLFFILLSVVFCFGEDGGRFYQLMVRQLANA